eukprot:6206994-Amphidinium_carterae.2
MNGLEIDNNVAMLLHKWQTEDNDIMNNRIRLGGQRHAVGESNDNLELADHHARGQVHPRTTQTLTLLCFDIVALHNAALPSFSKKKALDNESMMQFLNGLCTEHNDAVHTTCPWGGVKTWLTHIDICVYNTLVQPAHTLCMAT